MGINRVNISGNLTRDPEVRSTQGGAAVMNFGVAVNDGAKNPATGEWEDRPNYVDCVIFGTRAEKVAQYLAKGSKVAIEGRLRYSSWEKDGQKRSKLEVVVDEIEFMSRGDGGGQAPAQRQAPAQYQPPAFQPAPPQVQNMVDSAMAAGQARVASVINPSLAQPAGYAGPDLYDTDIPF